MVTTYGDFPGVQVSVAGGGITAITVGGQETLVFFGESSYQTDDPVFDTKSDGEADGLESGLNGSVETPQTINARREADKLFGAGSELADAMREALANGANVDFLYGVAPERYNVIDETQPNQQGALNNAPIFEEDVSNESNITTLTVSDDNVTDIPVRYSYDENLDVPGDAPTDDTADVDTVVVNPLTGEYIADQSPSGDFTFSYKYLDWTSVFDSSEVSGLVAENDTGLFVPLSDSDIVSADLSGTIDTLRTDEFKLINAVSGALPNTSETVTDSNGDYVRRDARYDTNNFSSGSVNQDYYFKVAPVRLENTTKTILGGVGGLFAGNPINDPIYNNVVSGYDTLEQSFTKTDADNMRGVGNAGPDTRVIPVRQAGSIRVKDNLSTSTETDWERDFWRRRIADRVILIARTIGDRIIGRINDEDTRNAAERFIRSELRQLVADRLLQPNTGDEQNWFVDVYEDSNNSDEVNIDIGFTPYGIVKRVDESITINT